MGFLDSFFNAFSDNDILDAYNAEGEDDFSNHNYRARGFENAQSNNGWYKCAKCGKSYRKGDMDIDHILPKSLGGDNSRENLQCICKHCNRSKGANTSDTYADLARRKKELEKQDKADKAFLKSVNQYKEKI